MAKIVVRLVILVSVVLLMNYYIPMYIHDQKQVKTAQSEEPVKTSISFTSKEMDITVLNSGHLTKQELRDFQDEFEKQMSDVLRLTRKALPKVKSVKFDTSTDYNLYSQLVLVFDRSFHSEEQSYYYQIVSNIFKQDSSRGRFTAVGLTGYLENTLKDLPVHEEYAYSWDNEHIPSIVVLLDPVEFSANYFHALPSEEEDVDISAETYFKVASFSSYLIETYGIDRFMKLYDSTDLVSNIEKIYQKTPLELEKEWKEYIEEYYL
ncbi:MULTISPECIES: hypothetical protein [unclassified Bacillus (in: firmicutes)]|uniref:hypothetical protein n=1 Tax=unclassified Bacillus (in: firmicutes) TaxID=185979 RepID=UPI0008EA53FC|nr:MULTISPECIES: hypothetical protein [unclassified Bacillus (in: firmicutes)]SFB04456.1 hypothetical protein SAMN02799634_104299 [Bacillus sp. UNCCL13]SFQ88503.1 hypothetical protein SAMN04488577_3215 [Bacillus sp. cl95]